MYRHALKLLALLCIALATPARADSWLPPSERTYTSPGGLYRLTVVPRPLAGALPYFADKVGGREPAGKPSGSTQRHPVGRLEWSTARGWSTVWQGPLVNDVAPVEAVVSDGGRFATFDNWHSLGYGDDAVVVYDRTGKPVRRVGLDALLPAAWIASLPRTVSSMHWRQDVVVEDGVVVIQILAPGQSLMADEPPTVDLRLGLDDGLPLAVQSTAWRDALAKAAKLDDARRHYWAALREMRARLLVAPAEPGHAKWRTYMEELRERLNLRAGRLHAGVVLPVEGEGHYPDSADGVADLLESAPEEENYGVTGLLLVSPNPRRLVDVVAAQLAAMDAGALSGVHLTVVVPVADAARLDDAAKRSGLRLTVLDPAAPVAGVAMPAAMPQDFIAEPDRPMPETRSIDAPSADRRPFDRGTLAMALAGVFALPVLGIAFVRHGASR
ncbi:hypothetical protein [Lysobacter humi (ex Lee et al. 2017)]